MIGCVYCGAPDEFACDAPGPTPGALCGKTLCPRHAYPKVEGAKDVGHYTLCEEHLHLQERRVVKPMSKTHHRRPGGDRVAQTAIDPTMKFATLTIDGNEYKLAYSFGSIALAESLTHCNLLTGLQNLADLTAGQLRGLFFAALGVAQPEITLEKVDSLLRLDTISLVTDVLAEAYVLSLEKKKDPSQAGGGAPAENQASAAS